MSHASTIQKLRINGPKETFHAHSDERFDHVAHIFHLEWHGIRSATSCLPGHKIGISADHVIDRDMVRRIMGFVYEKKIARIVYQGYSLNADTLARALAEAFGKKLEQYVITHVTSTQFEYGFEVEQQKRILKCLSDGVLTRIGSVKPDFCSVIAQYWPGTIYNAPPRLETYRPASAKSSSTAFVPLENTLRKNLYTNVIAAENAKRTSLVWTVNTPTGLEQLISLRKCRVIGYQRGNQLYDRFSEAAVVLNCTLAECQPMTQLEALAVGTPCLTGPLGLRELEDHPMTRLLEVRQVDTPKPITEALDNVLHHIQDEPDRFYQTLDDYLRLRVSLALSSLCGFLSI